MAWEAEIDRARECAMEAGTLALKYQKQGVSAEAKLDLSPVTIADKEGERLLAGKLLQAFPDDGIFGEEGAWVEGRSGRRWILDPIDGTRDFVRGMPFWAVLIGLEVEGQIAAGVVHAPALNATYWAARGSGAWCGSDRLHASRLQDPAEAVVCVNGLNFATRYGWGARLPERLAGAWAVRSLGGWMDAMMVASGKAEVWVEPTAEPWDLAPLQVILEEAGAVIEDLSGRRTIYGGNALAYVPAMRDTARALVSQ